MKRIISVVIALILTTICMCSCGSKEKNGRSDRKISIVATIFPGYDFARNIADENAEITMLLKPGTESHNYDPTPQDIIKIQDADLFIYVGGESDQWVDEILNSSSKKPKKVISMMDCVEKLEEEIVEGMQAEEDPDSDEVEYDEHVWTSPKNAIIISKRISSELKELDSSNAEAYEKRTNQYSKRLSAIDDEIRKTTETSERKMIVFGDRFPFKYLADEYGLNYYAAFPGCSSETEPSAKTVAFLIDKVRDEKIPVVFSIEFSNGKIADTICESTGAKKLTLNSCHNVTQKQFDDGVTYYDLMKENTEKLREALS